MINNTKQSQKEKYCKDSLGVVDLPDECARLMSDRMYAVVCELFEHRRALIQQLVSNDSPLLLITKTDPQKLLESVSPADNGLLQKFRQRVENGSVKIYPLQSSMFGKTGRRAVRQMIKELSYFVKARNALVVLENGSEMLGVGDSAHIGDYVGLWQTWLSKYPNRLLFLLNDMQNDPLTVNNLRVIQDKLAGLAMFNWSEQQVSWSVQHWYSPFGIVADKQFTISTNEQGLLQAQAIAGQVVSEAATPAIDRELVWTVKEIVQGEEYPQSWSISDSISALEQIAHTAVAGTIILPYRADTKLETLARTVHDLRNSQGLLIKIIIREVSARMRHSQERLFRHLGASLIVPMEIGFSRLLGIIESVKELEFDGHVSKDFDQAFILANPDRKQGYLAPLEFINEARDLIEQTRSFGIKYAFIKLAVYQTMKVRDVLKVCQIRRPGDICSADEQHIYLFLFGCRETDISKALTFVFSVAVTELFASEERNTSIDNTLLAIEALEVQALSGALKDHTQWLKAHQQFANEGPPQTVFEYRQTGGHFNQTQPIDAKPNPLLLKTDSQE